MCLNCGDRNGVDDIVHCAPAAEVIDRLVETLQHRAYSNRSSFALHGFVGIVARIQIGEDQDRCMTSHY